MDLLTQDPVAALADIVLVLQQILLVATAVLV
jgi:hypothetical protein